MSKRLPSLDGIRGLAALGVMLSHVDFHAISGISNPIIVGIFRTLGAGPNSVQILFVLAGFLMAYLYPTIPDAFAFIQKRYTRIFPIFLVITLFLWLTLVMRINLWVVQIVVLLTTAFFARLLWKVIQQHNTNQLLGKCIFFLFLMLQTVTAIGLFFFLPKLYFVISQGSQIGKTIILLANLTLTTPLSTFTPNLSGVFWSLAPEVLFYIFFPFIVLPLLGIGKKWGVFAGILLILCSTKIIFDLDHEVTYTAGLLVMNIGRSTGFIAGVTIGTIYQEKSNLWKLAEKILKNFYIQLLLLTLFFVLQWGDYAVRDLTNPIHSNYYFLFSSWVIALLILASLIKSSLINKLFQNKILVYLGLVSYSLYLSHMQVIAWITQILSPLQSRLSPIFYAPLFLCFVLLSTIGIASILFYTVESLYFLGKKKEHQKISLLQKTSTPIMPMKYISLGFSVLIVIVVIAVLYLNRFSSSLLLSRRFTSPLPVLKNTNVSPLTKNISIPFTATHNNLSIVSLDMTYENKAETTWRFKKNPAQLVFNLLDDRNHTIFSSHIDAFTVEGNPHYQFGFPPIANSQNKQYVATLALVGGDKNDQIIIDTSQSNFITLYTYKEVSKFTKPLLFLWNRIQFFFNTPELFFVFCFCCVCMLLYTKFPIFYWLRKDGLPTKRVPIIRQGRRVSMQ